MNNHIIDLRSDTVTRPSLAMRKAMMEAEVGDDVFGEDPTVNLLQRRVAELLGKEDALFTPSGVMANQLAIKCHTQPGDEVLVEQDSHIFSYETSAPSVLSGVQLSTLPGTNGILTAAQIEAAIRPPAYFMPRSSLICLENTHNRAGGTIYPLEEIREIHRLAQRRSLAMHLDGARLWNAWVATGIHPKEYAALFDTVSVCFSKGLGAPVGSAIVGTREVMSRARKFRKIFGGGMRQAGILAAAALFAIDHNIDRLKEDHAKASTLAEGLAEIPTAKIDRKRVQTNIVMIDMSGTRQPASALLGRLQTQRLLLTEAGPTVLRAVTHMDVSMDEIVRAVNIIKSVLSS
ncbi:MAG: low-specificity L-threonine aldolase [Ignavibacteriales bacterium]|nr:low-specificity L-threonine aldolase [Ignavibacteriales bacterium]